MKKTLMSLSISVLIVLSLAHYALPWNDAVTHKDISEYAAEISVLSASNGDYLKNLGFTAGIEENLLWGETGKKIRKWLATGSELEDVAPRWLNHFHNPLKPWLEAGFWGNNNSALFWAQNWGPPSGTAIQPTNDNWSWKTTRDHYYYALTMSSNAERQARFAQMFRGLGQQMHLLQDMAVPYHVRNDAHPANSVFESWCDPSSPLYMQNCGLFEAWVKNKYRSLVELKGAIPAPVLPVQLSNLDSSAYPALVPIVVYSDTGVYTGTNPSAGNNIGLAEYTNANFFSDDTIFAESSSLPYPKKTSTNLQYYLTNELLPETIVAEDGVPDTGVWIKKVADGEQIEHFLKPGYLSKDIYNHAGVTYAFDLSFTLDDKCNEDYAQKLLPRAVGYSAGLLNYFFRGQLKLDIDPNAPDQYYIRNLSSESMTGTFSVYYDDTSGNRHLVPGASWSDMTVYANDQSDPLTVPLQTNADVPGRYILVFQGTMGSEAGAVAGYVIPVQELAVGPPARCVYSLADGAAADQKFTYLKATLTNPNGAFQTGTLMAIARYKKRTDYQPDLSTDPPTAESREPEYSYSRSASINVVSDLPPDDLTALNGGAPIEVRFDFSGSPVPAGVTDLDFRVLFEGNARNADDTVSSIVAQGIRDVTEPTHLAFWNSTDLVYRNGALQANAAPFGIKTEISFCPPSGPVTEFDAVFDNVQPAGFGRLLVITDAAQGTPFMIERDTKLEDNYQFPISTILILQVINQEREGVFVNTSPFSFRGNNDHSGGLMFYDSASLYSDWSLWPAVPFSNAVSPTTIQEP